MQTHWGPLDRPLLPRITSIDFAFQGGPNHPKSDVHGRKRGCALQKTWVPLLSVGFKCVVVLAKCRIQSPGKALRLSWRLVIGVALSIFTDFVCVINPLFFGHHPVRTSMAVGLVMMAGLFASNSLQKTKVCPMLGITTSLHNR